MALAGAGQRGSTAAGRGTSTAGRRVSGLTQGSSGRSDSSNRSQTFFESLLPPATSGGVVVVGGGGAGGRLVRQSQSSSEPDVSKLDPTSFQRARAEAMGLSRGPSLSVSQSMLPPAPSGGGPSSPGASQQALPPLRGAPQLPQAGSTRGRAPVNTSSSQMSGIGLSLPQNLLDKSARAASVPPMRAGGAGVMGMLPELRTARGPQGAQGGRAEGEQQERRGGFMRGLFGRGGARGDGDGSGSGSSFGSGVAMGEKASPNGSGVPTAPDKRSSRGLLQRIFSTGKDEQQQANGAAAQAVAGANRRSLPEVQPGQSRSPGAGAAAPGGLSPHAPLRPNGFKERILI